MMEEQMTRDVDRIRLRMIDLIKSFFLEEPDAERLSRWRGIFAALGEEQISTSLDNAVKEISALLESKGLKDIAEEYYELLENPFGDHSLNLSASYYIDGKTYGETLANYRGFLQEAGVAKFAEVHDTEDSLAVILDCLASLIELDGHEGKVTAEYQHTLVNRYLAPLTSSLLKALEENTEADFYQVCGKFLYGYVELEKSLFELV